MTIVTVSPTYQLVIPRDARDKLEIRPGQKFEVFARGNRVELVPIESMEAFRGKYPELPALEPESDRL